MLLLLLASVVVLWSGLNLPPPLWLVKYGPAPGCERTGEVIPVEGVEFVVIGPGCFRMGSAALAEPGDLLGRVGAPLGLPWGTAPKPSNEMPVHWVEFPRGFAIARTEVTNAQYEAFDPEHPGRKWSEGDTDPVVYVSFEDAYAYCAWLSGKSGRPVRLPTEAEWECACRGGSRSEFSFGDDEAELGEYAWYYENSDLRTHEVGTRRANAWSLHDLYGNVCEWCADTYHPDYEGAPTDGSAWIAGGGPGSSPPYVLRGGNFAWWSMSGWRSAVRESWPGWRDIDLGFRPAFTPDAR